MFSKADIYEAQLKLAEVYRFDLCILIAQYYVYMLIAYSLLLWKAKSSSGLLGWSALKQGIKSSTIEPIMNYLTYGTFTIEMTRREREMLEFAKKKKRAKKILAENKKKEEERAAEKAKKTAKGAGGAMSALAENMASTEAAVRGGGGAGVGSDKGKGVGGFGFAGKK